MSQSILQRMVIISIYDFGVLTGQESIELHEKLEVDILTLRRLAVRIAHMMTVQIDTCIIEMVGLAKYFLVLDHKMCDICSWYLPIVAGSKVLILELRTDYSSIKQEINVLRSDFARRVVIAVVCVG